MGLQTQNLARCIDTLEGAIERLREQKEGTLDYEIFRIAVVKGFELSLEVSGKLLRKALRPYIASARAVDELTFKEVFRQAARHGLLEADAVNRWFSYRDNRNSTAHDYGQEFAQETLQLMPGFIADARALERTLRADLPDADA